MNFSAEEIFLATIYQYCLEAYQKTRRRTSITATGERGKTEDTNRGKQASFAPLLTKQLSSLLVLSKI